MRGAAAVLCYDDPVGPSSALYPGAWAGLLCQKIMCDGQAVVFRDLCSGEYVGEYNGKRLIRHEHREVVEARLRGEDYIHVKRFG